MWKSLQPREKRILKLLLATALLIGGYMLIEPLLRDYQQVKAESQQLQQTRLLLAGPVEMVPSFRAAISLVQPMSQVQQILLQVLLSYV